MQVALQKHLFHETSDQNIKTALFFPLWQELFEKIFYLYISCQKWAAIKKLIALALQINIFGRRNDVYEKHKLKKA